MFCARWHFSSIVAAVAVVTTTPVYALPVVRVGPGFGATLQFGEPLQKVWLDDPTELIVDFDKALPGATILHLRRIKPAPVPLQARAIGRDTLLTAVTTSGRVHQFRVQLVSGRGTGFLSVGGGPSPELYSIELIERGLQRAIAQGRLASDSSLASKVRQYVALVRQGTDPATAQTQTNLNPATLYEFSRIGIASDGMILERLRRKE
ncbi:MAG: hypothetical protein NZ482_01880 [Gloeomargarita sp. SKYG98]|nr:hypothetical protein [Gloeomargarita sp. SKYG98]